ncbi:hypothetical protein GCK72_008404 [Caenorhabditis remanei]|uniref:Uncharacterized protein n=1 Tax=Caenorhabditis remanei TaxID=31234 RepID=A0A6A5GXI0_CAERE|nr:hypothetical protein GCK72_008404 [Caenorhabditis remanei]KAF1760158.1 hypothetical protein GCK72_008404 [Caenorhabditis remanei]
MVSFDELSPQYQSGIRNFYQMPSHILQFLANARQNDANYFLEIHIPSFQSVAGIASVMFVAYSNLASTKKYSTTNWLDGICISAQSVSIGISLICILLAGLTIATGITLIFKLASGVPDGFLRVLVTGYMNLEARTSIMRICGGRANIESMLSTKSSRRQQSRIMILSFKDCTKAEKAVTNLNNSLLEIGLNASLVTDLDILNAMKVGGVNGWTGNYDACEDFKKEAEAGENLVSSLVLETLHQVDSFYDPFSCTTGKNSYT